MNQENLEAFIKHHSRLAREWVEARAEAYKLQLLRYTAKAAGLVVWMVVSLTLFFLLLIFTGVTTGFWLSSVTGSYTIGFGIVTAAVALILLLLAAFRKRIFIDPIIRHINRQDKDREKDRPGD